ncbi:hypothetical protein CMI37_07440 [Candidatus Pacearchaeota archaeon]|nr:hypothetical protein [Candidatus Pacearchaeota archaeon]
MAKRPKSLQAGSPFQPLWEDPPPNQIPQPWPPPQPFDDSGQWSNPGGTNPYPTPTKMPVGVWSGATQVVSCAAGATATWGSPVFDLRPEFRASDGRRPTPSIPIWKPSTITGGAGGKLWVQILNTDTENLFGLTVVAQEFGHISDVQNVVTCSGLEDVTTEFIPTAQSCLLTYVPPGAGYPVRFYQLQLAFSVAAFGAGVTFPIATAYY